MECSLSSKRRSALHSTTFKPSPTDAGERPAAIAIEARALEKAFKVYPSPIAQVADAIGLGRFLRVAAKEFIAIKGLNLRIAHGERVGIIGRNGAGKTTLLKLITGVIAPTSGSIVVNGNVQALMQVGMGFHPELSGLQNIRGALIYNGLSGSKLDQAIEDVLSFSELNEFLDRPLKTYSLGMKSRLQFAAATAVRPEILIVDEILGAGDAYFAVKSAERMRRLTQSGCTLLLVSHSMSQIHQFCKRVIWMEQGKILADGEPVDVINSYEEFIGRYHSASARQAESGESGPLPDWLREKLLREALEVRGHVSDDSDSTRVQRADRGARWDGPGPLRIRRISLLGADGNPTARLTGTGSFGIDVEICSEQAGTFPCTTIVFIYHEQGHTIARACSDAERISLGAGETTRRIAWFENNFLGNGRYMVSAGLYRSFEVLSPDSAERYDILSKTANFEVVGLPGDPSLVRIQPEWRLNDSVTGRSL